MPEFTEPKLDHWMENAAFFVRNERSRQEQLWGEQNHSLPDYFLILAEEFGEVAQLACKLRFEEDAQKIKDLEKDMVTELVQVAAVAQAIVESVLRRKYREAVSRETSKEVSNLVQG